jgi:hypothetical protein
MSILSFVEPIESVVPVAEDALAMAALALRTIGGLGAMAAMFVLFRPLLTGVWHALLISVKPRMTTAQRIARQLQQAGPQASRVTAKLAANFTAKTSRDVSSKENSIT